MAINQQQISVLSRVHDTSNMRHDWVWKYYDVLSRFKVQCNQCKNIFNTLDMRILKLHLFREHQIDDQDEHSVPNWLRQHFTILKGYTAECKYCPIQLCYMYGGLKEHLDKKHRDPNISTTHDGFTLTQDEYQATCNYCFEIINYLRDWHSLTRHLKTAHPDIDDVSVWNASASLDYGSDFDRISRQEGFCHKLSRPSFPVQSFREKRRAETNALNVYASDFNLGRMTSRMLSEQLKPVSFELPNQIFEETRTETDAVYTPSTSESTSRNVTNIQANVPTMRAKRKRTDTFEEINEQLCYRLLCSKTSKRTTKKHLDLKH